MGNGFLDRNDLGYFVLQDQRAGVLPHDRKFLAGGRLVRQGKVGDSGDAENSLMQFGKVGRDGTLGDIWPWSFWQTANKALRGMGSWSQVNAALVTGGGTGGFGTGNTGTKVKAAKVQPILGGELQADTRYSPKVPGWPKCFSALPQGVAVAVLPGTSESVQQDVMLWGDPRLFAPHTEGPGECGTLVVDLQPEGHPCMADAKPGLGGRHARLQSMMRVIPMNDRGIPELGVKPKLNAVAWNLSASGIDGIAGYGMAWGKLERSFTISGDGGVAPPGGDAPGRPPQFPPDKFSGVGPPRIAKPPSTGTGSGKGGSPCKYGRFKPESDGKHGSALMAHRNAYGPWCIGGVNDKHRIDIDEDGNPINSGHIHVDAYFYANESRDGPFFFEGLYRDPGPLPFSSRVHLEWDGDLGHPWVKGGKDGKWRWRAEYHVIKPKDGGGDDPTTKTPERPTTPGPGRPGGPTTPGRPVPPDGPTTPRGPGLVPNPGGPTTPSPGNGRGSGTRRTGPTTPGPGTGPFDPGGDDKPPFYTDREWQEVLRRRNKDPRTNGARVSKPGTVGAVSPDDTNLWMLHHPFAESFAMMAFRPELMVQGYTSFVHNPNTSERSAELDEFYRPQVLALRSWGAQTSAGEWDYKDRPLSSRARGGVANGGVLFTPPETTLEDHLGINSHGVGAPLSTGYFAFANGTRIGFGTPNLDGSLRSGFDISQQNSAKTFDIATLAADGTRVVSIRIEGDDTDFGEVLTHTNWGRFTGTTIPRGSTAQRPSTLTLDGTIRISTDLVSGYDTPEFYDTQQGDWRAFGAGTGGEAVTFTKTNVFAYKHDRGTRPSVQVLDSTGRQIEVHVTHTDADTVVLNFVGTLTNAVLVLS